MDHAVFISYSSHDRQLADALCSIVERGHARCWMAPRDILPGRSWGESIVDAIDHSRIMVVVLTGNANRSRHVVKEVERADSKGLSIIPLRLEALALDKSLEYFLSAQQWLEAVTRPVEPHFHSLAATVDRLLAAPGRETTPRSAERAYHEVAREFNELPPDEWGRAPRGRLGSFMRRLFEEN